MDDAWQQFNRYFWRSGGVLALGAGVSTRCKLPLWPELLCRLADRCIPDGRAIAEKLMKEASYPAVANMIEAEYFASGPPPRNMDGFRELLREELYREFKFFRTGDKGREREFVEFVRAENPTLAAVAALCVRAAPGGGFERNPDVHGVINFNLDSVLRAYTRARYGSDPLLLRTVERPSATSQPERTSVYQVHGFLSLDEKDFGNPQKEATDFWVLTEQQYFNFFSDPFSMFSYTFLHLLREHRCLFIGMSMKDDNVRRLLHYSRQERMRSHLRETRPEVKATERSTRHFAILPRTRDSEVDRLTAVGLLQLGVVVLWIDDFTEIPDRLGALYAVPGRRWADVYP